MRQSPYEFGVDQPGHAGVLNITCQQAEDILKGEQGIALAGIDITAAPSHDQFGPGIHCLAGKLDQQAGLTSPGFSGDENHLALTLRCLAKPFVEQLQLALPSDKGRLLFFYMGEFRP